MISGDNSLTNEAVITSAKTLFETEIDALKILQASIGDDFSRAIDIIMKLQGRVIVSGIGKSGHIASKIAATFASTGTPSFFVHPSEASHGDLGMITTKDAVLALSNSGNTSELFNLIAYCKRFSIPLIAMSSNEQSELGKNADVLLKLPNIKEACPMGLAPTTSTTMQLVLGDALAVALLEQKGFSADDFGQFHPGGTLGSRLMRVQDLMRSCPFVYEQDHLKDILLKIANGGLGCIAVVDQKERVLGIITDGDLRRHMGDDLYAQTALDLMTLDPKIASSEMLASEALHIMNSHNITSLLVCGDDNILQGAIHIHDLLRLGVK